MAKQRKTIAQFRARVARDNEQAALVAEGSVCHDELHGGNSGRLYIVRKAELIADAYYRNTYFGPFYSPSEAIAYSVKLDRKEGDVALYVEPLLFPWNPHQIRQEGHVRLH